MTIKRRKRKSRMERKQRQTSAVTKQDRENERGEQSTQLLSPSTTKTTVHYGNGVASVSPLKLHPINTHCATYILFKCTYGICM